MSRWAELELSSFGLSWVRMRSRLVGGWTGLGSIRGCQGLFWLKAGSPTQAPRSLLHPQPFPFLTWAFPTERNLVFVTTLGSSSYRVHLGKRAENGHSPFKSEWAWGIGVRPLGPPAFGSHGCGRSPACFTLFWGSLKTLASGHHLVAHQTPILAFQPHGCLSFPESAFLVSDLYFLEGPCCSQL